jgi:hypothetical protein
LKTIGDSRHPKHAAMREWVGGAFDPEEFDIAAANRALAGVLVRHAWAQRTTVLSVRYDVLSETSLAQVHWPG